MVKNNDFKEDEHPRDDDGKFTDGDNSNSNSKIKEWGNAYPEFSGKPKEAIEHLLKNKSGYVPAAITKEGLGDIDFVYGKGGEKGYGLAHIIERRNKDGVNGQTFVKQIPEIIHQGEVKIKPGHKGRKYITTSDNEISIRLDYNGEKKNWIVSAYVLHNKIKNNLTQADAGFRTYNISYPDEQSFPSSDLVRTSNIITLNKQDFNPTQTKYNKILNHIRNFKGVTMNKKEKAAPSTYGGTPTTGPWIKPVKGKVTSSYGRRTPVRLKNGKMSSSQHNGMDIAAPLKTPVVAPANGKVKMTYINGGLTSGYGRMVIIDHGEINGKQVISRYAHLNQWLVSPQQNVYQGQQIALVGDTGGVTGSHLHFEVMEDGHFVNPIKYIGTY